MRELSYLSKFGKLHLYKDHIWVLAITDNTNSGMIFTGHNLIQAVKEAVNHYKE